MVSDEQGSGSDADRRLAPRILVDIEVDYACEDTYLFAYITDMSALGIFVRTNAPEAKGTELHLRFTPPGEAKALSVEGRVCWVNPYRPGNMDSTHPGMGIEFVNVDDRTKQRLVELVRKIAYIDREE